MTAAELPCEFTPEPGAPNCPALAKWPARYCAAHQAMNDGTTDKVPGGKHPPTMCVRCGNEIRVGQFRKKHGSGYVHASYICEPKAEAEA